MTPTDDPAVPTLVGVGVGPGDPEHLTLGALRCLRAAGRVFAPTMAAEMAGRAETTVRLAAPDVAMERLVFAIAGDAEARAGAHRAAAGRVAACLEEGETVAFVTLGDPNVYSTFHHLAAAVAELRPGTPVRTVAGIMAFQDLAARSGTVVVDGAERLHLVAAVEGAGVLDAPLADPEAAIVIYKGGRHFPAIAERLRDAGRLPGAVWGELLGLPGQRLGPLADHPGPAAYLASIVVPPARSRGRSGREAGAGPASVGTGPAGGRR